MPFTGILYQIKKKKYGYEMPVRQPPNHSLFFSAFVIIVFALLLPSASHAQSSRYPIYIDSACYFCDYSHHFFLLNNILTRTSRNQKDLPLNIPEEVIYNMLEYWNV